MDLHDFYYDLPEELIAQDPLSDRSSSRLKVLLRLNSLFQVQRHQVLQLQMDRPSRRRKIVREFRSVLQPRRRLRILRMVLLRKTDN